MPDNQKIYHIVHKSRLASIMSDDRLCSDEIMSKRADDAGMIIGMSRIKERRLKELPVGEWANGTVGQCVPFYFCPRSVMLYKLHKADDDEVTYREGQRPIVHLVCDVDAVIAWAKRERRLWAFTSSNAATFYAQFYFTEADFNKLNWKAIQAQYWREVREDKQAEFLIRDSLPWDLVTEIGVYDEAMKIEVSLMLSGAKHKPVVTVYPEWYY